MTLFETRQKNALATGGVSPDAIKDLVIQCLVQKNAQGSLIDFGAGMGNFLLRAHGLQRFSALAGLDLFPKADSLPPDIEWFQHDLNEPIDLGQTFDNVVSTEVIEHLENPRQTFRNLSNLLKPGGLLILTTPNQESIRSYAALLFRGHFAQFVDAAYPAHITALLKRDLLRLCHEVGLSNPEIYYTTSGGVPKFPAVRWESVSMGLLKGRWFSDNIAVVARKRPETALPS